MGLSHTLIPRIRIELCNISPHFHWYSLEPLALLEAGSGKNLKVLDSKYSLHRFLVQSTARVTCAALPNKLQSSADDTQRHCLVVGVGGSVWHTANIDMASVADLVSEGEDEGLRPEVGVSLLPSSNTWIEGLLRAAAAADSGGC